jgi:ABC-type phosphate transport system substrate-binding protein
MRNRTRGTAAALALLVLVGCTSRPPTPSAATASVTVNGSDSKFNLVNCTQVEWFRTIHIGSDFSGVTVRVDERREPVTVTSVRIQNVAEFTGMYSQGDGSDGATTSLHSGKFTIAGTAHGSKTDKPNEPSTATFKIVVAC